MLAIEGKVELEHIDTRLAQNSQLTALRVLGDELSYHLWVKLAGLGHTADLVFRRPG